MEGNCNPGRLDLTGRSAALASSRTNPGAKQVELQKAKPLPTTGPVSVQACRPSIGRTVHSERYSSPLPKYFVGVQKYFASLRPYVSILMGLIVTECKLGMDRQECLSYASFLANLLELAHDMLKQFCKLAQTRGFRFAERRERIRQRFDAALAAFPKYFCAFCRGGQPDAAAVFRGVTF